MVLIGVFLFYWNNQVSQEKKDSQNKSGAAQVIKKEEAKVTENKSDSGQIKNSSFADLDGAKPIYYYGESCPHCKDVLAYLDKNDIYSKVDFIKKEVWKDKENSKELTEAAQKCGLNPANIGVPFVYDQGKCYMGGPDVEKFFGKEAGIVE